MIQPSESAVLTVAGLLVEVAERPLFSDFNLNVLEGALIEIKGPNGSGKTTLLRYLAGIRRARQGSIDFRGHRFAYVGQKTGLNASLTVFENLRWLTQNADQSASEHDLMFALSDLGLKSHRDTPVGALSAGQVRRCGLASLLALDAKIWLLDEPLTSLDESAINWLKHAITSHRNANGAAIVATHASLGLSGNETIDLNAS